MVASRLAAALDAEREAPVGRSVGHGGGEQREEVCQLRVHEPAAEQEDRQVGQGGGHPDAAEADELSEEASAGALFLGPGGGRQRSAGQGRAQVGNRDPARDQVPAQPCHAAQVREGRLDDVHAGIRVVGPVHRDFVDAQAALFCQDQQLGVEEPGVVQRVGKQLPGHVRPDRLEAALRVTEVGAHEGLEQEVVAARDEFPFGSADHAGVAGQPCPDRQVGVPGNERGKERAEGRQISGKIHIHVRQDRRRRGQPHLAECVSAALFCHMDHRHFAQLAGYPFRGLERSVGAGVVRHGDPEGMREGAEQVRVEPAQAGLEVPFLVKDRDGDVQQGRAGARINGRAPAAGAGQGPSDRARDGCVGQRKPRECPGGRRAGRRRRGAGQGSCGLVCECHGSTFPAAHMRALGSSCAGAVEVRAAGAGPAVETQRGPGSMRIRGLQGGGG
ncbi:hypothetical protein SRABI128_05740 [Microbacterium sp. Bi128]|nr:hypothetical protein SRABI128_05740 [Microbacterium sp. Bi128]